MADAPQDDRQNGPQEGQPSRRSSLLGTWLVGLVIGVAAISVGVVIWQGWTGKDLLVSAQGQFDDKAEPDGESDSKEEATKKKEIDPQIERLVVQPGDPQSEVQALKPGHWATGAERMQALYQDFIGELETSVVNQQGRPYPIDATPFVLTSKRPVALAKGQPKEIETTFLPPQVGTAVRVRSELVERGFGRSLRAQMPVTRMPAYQYFIVVLAKQPVRYALLKTLDSVSVPWDGETEADDSEDPLHYRVVTLPVERTIPLADNSLTWTSIAYVLWDEVDPQRFTPEQARAVVDWLHWGGQLVVSGPDSLDLLKGSFLEPYLPATSGGGRKITAKDLRQLNEHWLIATTGGGEPLSPQTPWSGVELVSQLGDGEVDQLGASTGGLLVERRVGRGRVVVSAMQLSERELVNWRGGFESLFNGGILRRPQREYRTGYYDELTLAWADPQLAEQRLEARLISGVRFFARDWGVDTNYKSADVPLDATSQWSPPEQQPVRELRPPEQVGGIGAWNDFSATASAARETLLEAAGVEVPDTSFVVICLALYLVALVPLNWLVFSAIGRVEWAWLAAPIIALAGTWVIVDRARLDIGFVRAQTEVGVLELQPNFERGHLSRYTALYTSLSTTYDIEFDNLTTVAAPFPTTSEPQEARHASGGVFVYERYDRVRLSGVFVPSNTTNMVHSEQMLPLDGAIRLGESSQGRPQIENRSQFVLRSVVVVERTSLEEEQGGQPALRGSWMGELQPGESRPVSFSQRVVMGPDESPFASERAAEVGLQGGSRLKLEPMFRLALDVKSFEPGEKRLVARIDEVLSGEAVSPAASQVGGAALVVAHLAYGARPEPLRDVNTRRDVVMSDSG